MHGKAFNIAKNPKLDGLQVLWEYQNIKIFLEKVTLQIRVKKFLWLKKLKILFYGHMLLVSFMFHEKELQKKSNRI